MLYNLAHSLPNHLVANLESFITLSAELTNYAAFTHGALSVVTLSKLSLLFKSAQTPLSANAF